MSRCYLCSADTSTEPTPAGMFLCERCNPRGNTATAVIEAALHCIADTSWSSAGDQRPKLAAALRAHFGEEEFKRRCDAFDRETIDRHGSLAALATPFESPDGSPWFIPKVGTFAEALRHALEGYPIIGDERMAKAIAQSIEQLPPIEIKAKASPDNPMRMDITYPHQPIGDVEVNFVGTFAPPDGAEVYVEPSPLAADKAEQERLILDALRGKSYTHASDCDVMRCWRDGSPTCTGEWHEIAKTGEVEVTVDVTGDWTNAAKPWIKGGQ